MAETTVGNHTTEPNVIGITNDGKRISKDLEMDDDTFLALESESVLQAKAKERRVLILSGIAITAIIIGVIASSIATGSTASNNNKVSGPVGAFDALEAFLPPAIVYARSQIAKAINPIGSIKGSLQAALTGTCPNYEYTWARDQALVFTTLMDTYDTDGASDDEVNEAFELLFDYANHTHSIYALNSAPLLYTDENLPFTLAEPKVEMDGSIYTGSWCRPQNDGPAGRAIVLMRFAKRYAALNNKSAKSMEFINQWLYNEDLTTGANQTDYTARNPIKRDLEFLVDKWNTEDCEPWEEVRGLHFYNRITIRRTMLMASEFVQEFSPASQAIKDTLSQKYRDVAKDIEVELEKHWDPELRNIWPTLANSDGDQGRSEDIQTVLATIHTYPEIDSYYNPTNSRVLANAVYTIQRFQGYFYTNNFMANYQGTSDISLYLGPAIGRYLGDVYNGGNDCNLPETICPAPCRGQPWFLATNSIAEVIFKAVQEYQVNGTITVDEVNSDFFKYIGVKVPNLDNGAVVWEANKNEQFHHALAAMVYTADSFLLRTMYHAGVGDELYRMDEQYNHVTGKQMSAGDLTWSYASLVTAYEARKKANIEKAVQDNQLKPAEKVDVQLILTNVPVDTNYESIAVSVGESETNLFHRRTIGDRAEWSGIVRLPASTESELKISMKNSSGTLEYKQQKITYKATDKNPMEPFVVPICESSECAKFADYVAPQNTPVTFRVYDVPAEATRLRLIGDLGEFGSWGPCNAVDDTVWLTKVADSGALGDYWETTTSIPLQDMQYKFRMNVAGDDEGDCDAGIWEVIPPTEVTNKRFLGEYYKPNMIVLSRYTEENVFRGEQTIEPATPRTLVPFRAEGLPDTCGEVRVVGSWLAPTFSWNPCLGPMLTKSTTTDGVWEGTLEPASITDFGYKLHCTSTGETCSSSTGWETISGDNMFVADAWIEESVVLDVWNKIDIIGQTYSPTASPVVPVTLSPTATGVELVRVRVHSVPTGTIKLFLVGNTTDLGSDDACAAEASAQNFVKVVEDPEKGDQYEAQLIKPDGIVSFRIFATTSTVDCNSSDGYGNVATTTFTMDPALLLENQIFFLDFTAEGVEHVAAREVTFRLTCGTAGAGTLCTDPNSVVRIVGERVEFGSWNACMYDTETMFSPYDANSDTRVLKMALQQFPAAEFEFKTFTMADSSTCGGNAGWSGGENYKADSSFVVHEFNWQ